MNGRTQTPAVVGARAKWPRNSKIMHTEIHITREYIRYDTKDTIIFIVSSIFVWIMLLIDRTVGSSRFEIWTRARASAVILMNDSWGTDKSEIHINVNKKHYLEERDRSERICETTWEQSIPESATWTRRSSCRATSLYAKW